MLLALGSRPFDITDRTIVVAVLGDHAANGTEALGRVQQLLTAGADLVAMADDVQVADGAGFDVVSDEILGRDNCAPDDTDTTLVLGGADPWPSIGRLVTDLRRGVRVIRVAGDVVDVRRVRRVVDVTGRLLDTRAARHDDVAEAASR